MKKALSIVLSIATIITTLLCTGLVANASVKSTSLCGDCSGYYSGYQSNNLIDGSNDYDSYYQLNVNEGGKATITLDRASTYGEWTVTVYNSNYSYIRDFYFNGSENTMSFNVSAGTYYFDVTPPSVSKLSLLDYSLYVSFTANITPSNIRVTERGTNYLTIAWNGISSVDGFELQKKYNGVYHTIENTDSTSATVYDLSSATVYSFRIRSYRYVDGSKEYSSWKTFKATTRAKKVNILTPATNSKHQIIAKWQTVARATGYQVQYCRNKSCSDVIATRNVTGQSKTSYTGKNFTKGRTYYVRVRAYRTVDGTKYYGSWSTVMKVKSK